MVGICVSVASLRHRGVVSVLAHSLSLILISFKGRFSSLSSTYHPNSYGISDFDSSWTHPMTRRTLRKARSNSGNRRLVHGR